MTRISQPSFPNGTQAPQSTGCTVTLPTPKSVPTVVVIGQHVDFRRPSILFYGSYWQTFANSTTQVPSFFAYLDDWYVWIKPQYLVQTFVLIAAATRTVKLELQPSKVQIWRASCQDPIPPELQDKVKITLSCLGGHLQIHGDIEPSPTVLGEQATMDKTTQHFQRIASTLTDLNAEGLNAETVNDLLTMKVGAASQCVLRMSFVPEQEAWNFDMPTSLNATSLLHCFFYLSNLEDLVWALRFSGMLPLHGVLGSRSFPHSRYR